MPPLVSPTQCDDVELIRYLDMLNLYYFSVILSVKLCRNWGIIKGRNVPMEVKRGLRNSVILLTLTCGSETWAWNRAQQSRVRAVEMRYLRGACGVTRWDGESNESVYEK